MNGKLSPFVVRSEEFGSEDTPSSADGIRAVACLLRLCSNEGNLAVDGPIACGLGDALEVIARLVTLERRRDT